MVDGAQLVGPALHTTAHVEPGQARLIEPLKGDRGA
jgi:hypothetical protein